MNTSSWILGEYPIEFCVLQCLACGGGWWKKERYDREREAYINISCDTQSHNFFFLELMINAVQLTRKCSMSKQNSSVAFLMRLQKRENGESQNIYIGFTLLSLSSFLPRPCFLHRFVSFFLTS